MKTLITTLTVFLSAINPVNAMEPPNFYGLWLTENERAVIKIAPCEDEVESQSETKENSTCGHIHWVIDGGMQHDSLSPDETKRKTPMCNLKILWGFEQGKEIYKRKNGKIYRADTGETYSATIALPTSNNELTVHGYIGLPLIGTTQNWTRVSEEDYEGCEVSKED